MRLIPNTITAFGHLGSRAPRGLASEVDMLLPRGSNATGRKCKRTSPAAVTRVTQIQNIERIYSGLLGGSCRSSFVFCSTGATMTSHSLTLWRYPAGGRRRRRYLVSIFLELWMEVDLFELTAGPGRHSVSET